MYRLISFDLMGTLIKPKTCIGKQYIEAILRQGASGSYCDEQVRKQFYESYKLQSKEQPVFGFYTQLDSVDWWRAVFQNTWKNNSELTSSQIADAFDDVYHNFEYDLIPGAAELLTDIKRKNCKVAVYSNTGRFKTLLCNKIRA